jgi:cytosine deaminase
MTTKNQWPDGPNIHVVDARVQRSLLSEDIRDELGTPDPDGLMRVDLAISGGKITHILPTGSPPRGDVYDARGGQVWPLFADLHTHLDKGHTWPRANNASGTIENARLAVRADTVANWCDADVEARFEFALRCAFAHGTGAIRTHLDCLVPGQAAISFEVFSRLRERWSGRIEIQAVALVSTDLYAAPQNASIVDLIADHGGILGAPTFRLFESEDPSLLDGRLDHLFTLAKSRGLDVDLHVDENGSPSSRTLAQVARAVIRNEFSGSVVAGHCCSLSVLDDVHAEQTIELTRQAGITVASMPLVNQYLQGRRGGHTPLWRGIPLLSELKAAGVPVALGSDNCRDPMHAFGDLDMLEVLGSGIRLGHLDAVMGEWATAITSTPKRAMGDRSGGLIGPGVSADLVLCNGRTYTELFARRQADRLVIRKGRLSNAELPDYRDLDHLYETQRPQR